MRPEAEAALATWEFEHATTLRVLRAVPEGRMDVRAAEKGWRLGDLAWHLCTAERWFCVDAMGAEAPATNPVPKAACPATVAAMIAAVEASHATLVAGIRGKDDAWMDTVVEFKGIRMTRLQVLDLMFRHGAHHRGQLSVYLRLAGARVPSIYGPSADDAG